MKSDESLFPESVAELAALGKLFEEHRARLLGMLQRRLDPALATRLDAEDILSEAFLLARGKWHTFKQSNMNPYSWLHRIAQDCLIEAWRRENRDCRNLNRQMPWPERSSIQLGLVAPGTGPVSAALRDEEQQQLQQALKLLTPGDREVLWMRHDDQLSFKEIAGVLDLTESAATLRYVRALKRLKKHWHELNGTE